MNPLEWVLNKIISLVFKLWPQPQPSLDRLQAAKLVAHRGVHEEFVAQENSLESFKLAVQNKIWAIEFDVRFTKDHVPVIHHDPHCGRLFNRRDLVISECTFAELKSAISLPSLAEVVSLFGQKIHLMIEVKEDLRVTPAHASALKQALQSLNPVKDYHLLTLNPYFFESIHWLDACALLDVIWLNANHSFRANRELKHGAIAGHFLFFTRQKIAELKSQKKQVGVGFIDSKNSLFRELNRDVDYIFTNHPLRLNSYLKQSP